MENIAEVEELLGFIPEDIILSGDSSGACLCTTALFVLSEMRKLWPNEVVKYPTALFGFYPSFCLAPVLFPSYIITGTTAFLSPIAFALFADSYTPVISTSSSDVNANYATKSRMMIEGDEREASLETDISRPLFETDLSRQQLKEKILRRNKITEHPLFSPLLYEDMDSLKDVSIFLFACMKDPILDHSVCLTRKWKGNKKLDIFNNLQHGFLNLIGIDSNAKEGADFIADRLRTFIRL
jgi:acetyl esterase/lipase